MGGRLVVVALGAAACLVLPMDAWARPPHEMPQPPTTTDLDAGNSDPSDEGAPDPAEGASTTSTVPSTSTTTTTVPSTAPTLVADDTEVAGGGPTTPDPVMTATSDPGADRVDDDVSPPAEPEVVIRPEVTTEGVVRSATVTASATCSVSRTVRPGDGGGPDHRCVEMRLSQLGYAVQGPNRVFDSTTLTSLRRFARERGVTWRGVVTPLLLVRLRIWSGPAFGGPCSVSRTVRPGAGVGRTIVVWRIGWRSWGSTCTRTGSSTARR